MAKSTHILQRFVVFFGNLQTFPTFLKLFIPNSRKREFTQEERAIYLSLGRAAFGQAEMLGDAHERTRQAGSGGQTKKGWESQLDNISTLPLLSHSFHSTLHSTSHHISYCHSAHLSCGLMMFRSPSSCPKMIFWRSKRSIF
jgi:hypothetical protein